MASLTVYQMSAIILRRRDRQGRLVRVDNDLPQHVIDSTDSDGMRRVRNQVSFGDAYVRAKMTRHKLTKDQAVQQWNDYLQKLRDERAASRAKRGNK